MAALTIRDLAGPFHNLLGIEAAGGIGCRNRQIRTGRLRMLDPLSRGEPHHPGTIPILQPEGLAQLSGLSKSLKGALFRSLVRGGAPCLLLSSALSIPPFLKGLSRRFRLPVLASSLEGAHLESRFKGLVREHCDGIKRIHGCLVVVSGIGILITGEHGTGKTTTALRLAEWEGGAWVADDAVDLSRRGDAVYGRAPGRIRGLAAVPGRGIVRVSRLIPGVRIREEAPVGGVVRLVRREGERDGEWSGTGERCDAYRVLGLERPFCELAVQEGEPAHHRIAGWAATLDSGGMKP